jgi:hypothetical protein
MKAKGPDVSAEASRRPGIPNPYLHSAAVSRWLQVEEREAGVSPVPGRNRTAALGNGKSLEIGVGGFAGAQEWRGRWPCESTNYRLARASSNSTPIRLQLEPDGWRSGGQEGARRGRTPGARREWGTGAPEGRS